MAIARRPVADDREVLDVAGEKDGTVNVGGRRDSEGGKPFVRLSSAGSDRHPQSTPLSRDSIVDRQRVGESRFD